MRTYATVLSLALVLPLSAQAQAVGDEDFLSQAMAIDLSEIAMGQLAQQHGAADQTRRFGRQLVVDHVSNAGRVVALSRGMGIDIPAMPPADDMAAHDQLTAMSGPGFDRAFAARMVDGHRKAIDLFEAKAGDDGEVADFAEETLPTLEGHLQLAEGILGEAGDGGAADVAGTHPTVDRPVTGIAAAGTEDAARGGGRAVAPDTVSADSLIGVTVYGADNESIGAISDVILATGGDKGAIDAVVIDVGGFLGIGAKPVAVGFDSIELRSDENGTTHAYSRYLREQLDAAPAYDADAYPEERATMRLTPGS